MIEINNQTRMAVDERFLVRVAERVLQEEGKAGMSLSVALIGEKKARELNRRYRQKDTVPNVLSFEVPEVDPARGQGLPGQGLGEIILCPAKIRKDAKKYGITVKETLAWMLVHGILHLLGYEHERNEEEARHMTERERSYLQKLV